jgi:hypothetical protein
LTPHPQAVPVRLDAERREPARQPEATPSLFSMVEIELALSPLLEGRKVDLRTAGDLSRYFRDEGVRMAGAPI